MLNLEKGDKVNLVVGRSVFKRTVSEIVGFAVYLSEGGDCFDSRTGKVWNSSKESKIITLS